MKQRTSCRSKATGKVKVQGQADLEHNCPGMGPGAEIIMSDLYYTFMWLWKEMLT